MDIGKLEEILSRIDNLLTQKEMNLERLRTRIALMFEIEEDFVKEIKQDLSTAMDIIKNNPKH